MKSFEDLFGTNENLEQANGGEIREIPLASLHTFRNHPFQIHEDKLEEMVESVRQYGVLVPGIARMRPQGGYEIIAGHTRKAACELAGLDTMPMFIRNLNDDEATIVMVDSNIQREDIFPSEKARAYSMRYYAMKHQGIKGNKGSSLDIMSEETGENAKKIQRYIRLAKLSDELLDFVDRKKIGFIQGADLSYLNEKQQQWVLDIILDRNVFPNIEQSARLKVFCRENMLTQEEVRNIMLPEQVSAKPRSISANSAVRSFIRTAQGRDFAILTVQKPISRQKKRRNALPKRESTPSVKRSARYAASPSGRPTVRRYCAPRNARQSTAGRNSLPTITVSNPSRKPEKQYNSRRTTQWKNSSQTNGQACAMSLSGTTI